MIISTVTLNPAVDRTYYVNGFKTDALNRAWKTVTNIGGKGTNVSSVFKICGYDTISSGFLAGTNGRFIEETLLNHGMETDFVYVPGETRVNIKIADLEGGTFTDINECGPSPAEKDVSELCRKIQEIAKKSDIVHFGGSIPPGLDQGIYKTLISVAAECGAKTVLDAGDEALCEGIKAHPSVIKPNRTEFELMLDRKLGNISEIAAAAEEIHRDGVETVLVSLGGNGAIGVSGDGIYRVYSVNVPVKSTVGAGDCFLAGYLHGVLCGETMEEALKTATSFATAKIRLEGTQMPSYDELFEVKSSVCTEKIG